MLAIREAANKAIGVVRKAGGVGSSLQADLVIAANADDRALLVCWATTPKFFTITSAVSVVEGDELAVTVTPSTAPKASAGPGASTWAPMPRIRRSALHEQLVRHGEVRSVA